MCKTVKIVNVWEWISNSEISYLDIRPHPRPVPQVCAESCRLLVCFHVTAALSGVYDPNLKAHSEQPFPQLWPVFNLISETLTGIYQHQTRTHLAQTQVLNLRTAENGFDKFWTKTTKYKVFCLWGVFTSVFVT